MTDLALPLLSTRKPVVRFGWLARLRHLWRAHARLRRRRFRDLATCHGGDWLLALPQSRHGG